MTESDILVSWNSCDEADGYVIEGEYSGQWKRLLFVSANASQQIEIRKKEIQTEQLRIIPVKMYRNLQEKIGKEQYINLVEKHRKTTIPQITSVRLVKRACSAARIAWEVVGKVKGYEIAQLENAEWRTISVIDDPAVTELKISLLKPAMHYKFRVRPIFLKKSVVRYGKAKSISVTTRSKKNSNEQK